MRASHTSSKKSLMHKSEVRACTNITDLFQYAAGMGNNFNKYRQKRHETELRLFLVKKTEARPHYAPAAMIRSMKHCSIEQIHALCLQ